MSNRWYDAVLEKWQYDSDDELDCSYGRSASAEPPPAVVIDPFDENGFLFVGTSITGYYQPPGKTYPYTTPVAADGFAPLVPAPRGSPDVNNVALTLIPSVAMPPQSGSSANYWSYYSSLSNAPFGSFIPALFVTNNGGAANNCPMKIPVTYPTTATFPVILFLHPLLAGRAAVTVNGVSMSSSKTDGGLIQMRFDLPRGSGTPGVSTQTIITISVAYGGATTSYAISTVATMLATDVSFDYKAFPPPLGSFATFPRSDLIQRFASAVSRTFATWSPIIIGNGGFRINTIGRGKWYTSWGSGVSYSQNIAVQNYLIGMETNPAAASLTIIPVDSTEYFISGYSECVKAV